MLARRLARLGSTASSASHAVAAVTTVTASPITNAGNTYASMPAAATEEKPKKLHSKEGKVLHPDLISELFRKCQYAVRGELYLRAEELRQQGREIVFTNGA